MKAFVCAALTLSLVLLPSSARGTSTPEALTLPAHALVLTMLERELDYDAGNREFVWLAAYYALTLSAADDPQAQWISDRLTLPADRLAPVLGRMFPAPYSLPEDTNRPDRILALSGDGRSLRLAAGDPGQTQLVWLEVDGDTWLAALVSPDAEQPLCWAQITLNQAQSTIVQCTVTQEMPQTDLSAALSYSRPARA